MKSIVKWSIVCAVSAFLTQGALADGQKSGEQSSAKQSQQSFQVSKLIGKTAKDSQGKDVGKLSDVFINPQNNEIFGVVDLGNDRYAPIPWQLMQVTTDNSGNQQLSLNSTKDNLKAAPTVEKDQFSSLNDSSFTDRVYGYFNTQAPSAMGAPGSGSDQTSGQQQKNQPMHECPAPGQE